MWSLILNCIDHTAAISLHQTPFSPQEEGAQSWSRQAKRRIGAFSKQTTYLSQGRFCIGGYADDFRALCSVSVPTIWLLFQLPQACNVKFESSVFSLRCLFIFGSCQGTTIECSSSSFNTKLQRMYPVQVLRGAACCCKILPRLLPLLLVMQFCFEEVLGERNFILICFAVSLQTEYSVVLRAVSIQSITGRLKVHNTEKGLPALPLSPFLYRTWPMRLYWRLARRLRWPISWLCRPRGPNSTRTSRWDPVQMSLRPSPADLYPNHEAVYGSQRWVGLETYCRHHIQCTHVWRFYGRVYWPHLNRDAHEPVTVQSWGEAKTLCKMKGTGGCSCQISSWSSSSGCDTHLMEAIKVLSTWLPQFASKFWKSNLSTKTW